MPRLLAAFFPSFPLQVAVRATPGLRGKDTGAFAVADTDLAASGRREVPPNADLIAVSAAARRAGVQIGMTVTQARVLAPGIVLRPRDPSAHEAARIAAAEVLSGFGPRVEVSDDGAAAWVDVTGETAAAETRIAREAAAALKIAGFVARIAIAGERFTARAVAQHAKSGRVTDARAALAPLPVSALAAAARGIEERRATAKALEAFRRLGLATLGEVARLPADTLARRFGTGASRFSALARGEDTTPLAVFRIPATLFEKIDLPAPAEQIEPLLFALKMLMDRVGARLTGRGRAASKLAVHLVLEHAPAATLDLRLPKPSLSTKTVLEVARERLGRLTLPGAVTEMALEVVDSVPTRRTQLALFDDAGEPIDPRRAPPSPEKLAVTLGRLATAFGDGAVFAARLADEHRPERAYTPVALDVRQPDAPPPDPDARRPVRMLAVPEAVAFSPRAGELVVRGHRHRVETVSAPERHSGEWWDVPYDRDYYLIRTDDGSAWWIFHDRAQDDWRLHGLFD